MELINNRYKVEGFLPRGNFENYIIRDSLDKDNLKSMRIIDGGKNKDLVDFYMEEFIWLKNIKHKKLLNIQAFGPVETINLKNINLPLYYVITDISPESTLEEVKDNLSFMERIKIIQQLISIIDYLHFRGFSYKYLDPRRIFYTERDGLKLSSLASVTEYDFARSLDEYSEDFIAPSVLIRKDRNDINTDYYSLSMIMGYLLLDDFLEENTFKFKQDLGIKEDEEALLTDIIRTLINAYKNDDELSLLHINDRLNEIIDDKFINNFKEDREHLYFKTKLIGRDKELDYIKGVHSRMINNSLDFNGVIFKGISGVGKTRFINEIAFRLRIRLSNVFRVNVDQSLSYDMDIIRIFLNILTYNVDNSILERYKSTFKRYIPEKFGYEENYVNENTLQKVELYKLFNSLCNYLKEIALDKPVYIIIDNITRYNETFLSLIDYLFQSLFNSKVFIILTYDEFNEVANFASLIRKWKEEKLIQEIKLENLSKEDIGVLVQNILGMSFAPAKFASVLYESSKGNPRFLDLIIKEIYNNKELYISDEGRWFSEKDNYTELALPTDLKKTLIKQTKDITGDKLKILKLISISNESLSKFIIYNMLDLDIKYLNNIINSLLNEQILVESSYDNSYYYGFLSNELKATVYYDIDDSEKKLLHNKLAQLLIEYKPNIIRDLVEETAYHLMRAGLRKAAIDLIVNEAHKIDNIYSSKAISLWERAFSIVKDIRHEKRIEVFESLTKINLHVSNAKKLELYLQEFLNEAEELEDLKYIIKAKNYYAEMYLRNNDLEKLEIVIEETYKISSENNYLEGKILSDALSITTLIKDANSDRSYIKSILDRALHQSREHNITAYLGKIYFQYGLFFDINGDPHESIKNYEKSIVYLEKNGDVYETIKAINNIGNVCLERIGDKDKCFIYFKKGLQKANEHGFTHLESIILHNIGEAYLNIFDYKKAMEYTEKSIMLAETNKYTSVIIVSNCNLGRIYLLTNQYDKAYKIYTFIKSVYIEELITDSEVIIAYRNFLGEFYFNFGKYDLAIKYTNLVKEIALGFSVKYYFESIFRIIQITYINGRINKGEVFAILEEYRKKDINEVYNWNILVLVSISLRKLDFKFGNELMKYYLEISKLNESDLIRDTYVILSLYLGRNENNLMELENKINEIEKKKNYNIELGLYIQFANLYEELGEHKKSMRYNIKAFDGIYKSVDSINEFDLKLSFLDKLNVQKVKNNINSILNKFYGMDISSIGFEEINDNNFHEYFDLTPVIDSLTKKEINDIVSYIDDMKIDNIGELLSKLDGNYLLNIKLILKYLGKETLAQRGLILKYNEDRFSLEPLVSLVDKDDNLPNEMILLQSLRQKNGFLFNFTFQGLSQNRHSTYIPKNARGIICVPITAKGTADSVDVINSFDAKDKDVYGYIYLETDNALNRFDLERSKLVNSLSKLISLNMQNEDLRINSTTDKLTGVYNRDYFELKVELMLEEFINKPGKLSIFMIDIDNFKTFNDKYGHLKGDEVLVQVANTIKTSLDSRGIVGRYGGEEFIVLLWEHDLEEARNIGNEIRKNIEKSHIPGIEDKITISIGLAQYPLHGSYQMELVNNADQALYYAKEMLSRNNLAVWDKDMKGHSKRIDKTKGLVTSNPTESNRNILQMIDISESIKLNKKMEDKIYQLLGTIITISNCEYVTFIELEEGQIKSYTRKRQVAELTEENHINLTLVEEVKRNKMGIYTIGWHDDIKDNFNLPDWDSVLVVPLIKEDVVKAILYITVPLREKEFNQDTLNVVNLFSTIFSGNY